MAGSPRAESIASASPAAVSRLRGIGSGPTPRSRTRRPQKGLVAVEGDDDGGHTRADAGRGRPGPAMVGDRRYPGEQPLSRGRAESYGHQGAPRHRCDPPVAGRRAGHGDRGRPRGPDRHPSRRRPGTPATRRASCDAPPSCCRTRLRTRTSDARRDLFDGRLARRLHRRPGRRHHCAAALRGGPAIGHRRDTRGRCPPDGTRLYETMLRWETADQDAHKQRRLPWRLRKHAEPGWPRQVRAQASAARRRRSSSRRRRLLGRPSPRTAMIPGRTSVTTGGGVWST